MPELSASLNRTALAISSFRSDARILRSLADLFSSGHCEFGAVIVVDSLGSGRIADAISQGGWPVHYENADRNLGSAGNLERRLRLAAELGCEWCLAVNHDGSIDVTAARRLVEHGEELENVGAVYPTLRMTSADGRLDRPRRRRSTFGLLTSRPLHSNIKNVTDVAWSSSNGALYRLEPVRRGMHLWSELWMGYEDLALGWELERLGWRQILANDVQVDDNYEFTRVKIFGRVLHLADKPIWYSYYQGRNLWLLAARTRGRAISRLSATIRAMTDVALILGFREDKRQRIFLLIQGLYDALRGVTGKGPVP